MNKRDADIRYGLGLHNPDDLDRWREEGEKRERERQRAVAERTESESITQLRADVAAEFEAIRMEMAERQELTHEAVGETLGEFSASAEDCTERAIKRLQEEFWNVLASRFAEVNARIDMLSGGKATRQEKFRSASEPVQDLPNPLPRRAGLN
jgi:hypothetical protein